MKSMKFVLPAMLMAAFAVPAFVGTAAAESPRRHADGKVVMMDRHHPADTNKDGVLSREEYDAFNAARFSEMDKDGDGTVSREEMKAHHETMREKFKERRGERGERGGRGDMRGDGHGRGYGHDRGEAAPVPVPEVKQ